MSGATAPITLPIKIPGMNDLQKLGRKMEQLERDIAKVNKQLPVAANNIRKTGKAAGTATGNIQRMGIAFRSTVAPIVAVYGALNFLNKSLKTAGQREADVALLTSALARIGKSTDLERLQKQADKFGNATLFNQEDFTAGAGLLTSFTDIAVDSYERVITAASDLAQTNKGALKDSLLQVAKALNDPVQGLTALGRSGIQFSESQKEVIRSLVETGDKAKAQQLILKELERQYGGNAAAAAQGLSGAMDTLGEEFRDFMEVVGKGVMPVVTDLVKQLTGLFNTLKQVDPAVIEMIARAVAITAKIGAVVFAVVGLKAAIVALKATALASWFGPVLAQLALGNTAFAGFILKAKAAAVAVKGLKIAMVALKVAMLALPVAIVVGGLLAINKLLRKNADDASAMGIAIAEDGLKQATANLERVTQEKNQRDAAGLELNSKRLDQERQIEQVLRNQLSSVVSREQLEQQSLNAAQSRVDNQNTLMEARFGLFMKLNELEIQRAKNAGDTNKQYQLQVRQADLVYQKSILQIKADVKKAEMAALQVKIEFKKLEAATKLKAAKGELQQADLEALALQKQAVQLSLEGVKTAQLAANYNMQTAGAIRQMTVEQLKFNSAARAGASISRGGGGGGSGGLANNEYIQKMASAVTAKQAETTRQIEYVKRMEGKSGFKNMTGPGRQDYIKAGIDPNPQPLVNPSYGQIVERVKWNKMLEKNAASIGYAKGGYVSSPTNALIGEGGESEYVIPSSKMQESVRRYSAGARGSAVVAGGNDAAAGGGGGGASYSTENNAYVGGGSNQINVTTGPVMKMNGQNYVSMGDLQRGLSEAVSAAEVNMSSRMRRSYAARRSMGL